MSPYRNDKHQTIMTFNLSKQCWWSLSTFLERGRLQRDMKGIKFSRRLTHWGRVTHICVSKQTNTGLDYGLSPGRRQAIIRSNAGILLIRPLGTNFSEFLVEILIFSLKKMRLKVSSAKRPPFCLGLNELNTVRMVKNGYNYLQLLRLI